MKARPILMSAPMVIATLDGRKSQTRRTKGLEYFSRAENEPDRWRCVRVRDGVAFFVFDNCPTEREVRCSFGKPGDFLWVRETWCPLTTGRAYRADPIWNACPGDKWRPSIHMPRFASRLTLCITDVRVERLNDISEADARAEGVLYVPGHGDITPGELHSDPGYSNYLNCRMGFEALWESLNGAGSWAANPWVWVISYKTIKGNVDHVLREAA